MTLEELKAVITTEWTVRIIDHGYSNDGRDDVKIENVTERGMTLRPKKSWESQGRKFSTMEFTWDKDPGLVEVREAPRGTAFSPHSVRVDCYYMPKSITSRSTPGVRECYKSFVFSAPRGY